MPRARWMSPRQHGSIAARRVRGCLVVAAVLIGSLVCVAPAFAGAWWRLSARAAPTYLPPSGVGLLDVSAEDLGSSGVSGSGTQITLTDVLPVGLSVTEAGAVNPHRARVGNRDAGEKEKFWKCQVIERQVSCSTHLSVSSFEPLEMEIPVKVSAPSGASLANEASVAGGEAQGGGAIAGSSLRRALTVSSLPVAFGIEEGGYTITPEEEGGMVDTQAGSHPFQLTSTVFFDQTIEEVQDPGEEKQLLEPAAPAVTKDVSFQLPPGLLGAATATEKCSSSEFSTVQVGNLCPAGSAVGVATVTILEPSRAGYLTLAVPVFNLEPAQGEPARFGFVADAVPVVLDTAVRTSGDYGVTVSVNDASAAAQVLGAQVTFWGQPGSESHDSSRGWACLREGIERNPGETCQPPKHRSTIPLLTLPTECDGQLSTLMAGDAWTGQQLTSQYTLENAVGGSLEALTGCAALPFSPTLATAPEQPAEAGHAAEPTSSASTPTGLQADVRVDQQGTLTEGQLADADVQSATVTLPPGMLLNPSAANGLQACTEEQIGYLGAVANDPLAPGTHTPAAFSNAPAQCPQASKIATVRIRTPLLSEELQGTVYLAAQEANPFGSLIALYIVAEDEILGLRVKLAGEGKLNPSTGQVTTSFQDTPQVPFEELALQLYGGPRGALSTPALCGTYTATTQFTAWSGALAEPAGEPFSITSGPGGGPCPAGPLPFTPAFTAGVPGLQAASFTPFTLTIADPDADQRLQGLTMTLPDGVAALLSTVSACQEPPAGQEWACGPASLIGHSTAWAGFGSEPVTFPGTVYLTTGYGGAPFGLLDITPAVAGPYNLGNVDVRSKINVNPTTAQVTITSDPFPTFVQGIPADIKQLNVTVDRPGFEFNPTNCNPTAITGTLTGANGASEPVSSPFQVQGCQNLPFKPTLTASAAGKGSKTNGTSFNVTLESKGLGQANIAKVDLQLPKALSSRLPTLQKACLATTFNTNPASCAETSIIGTATIHTPVLTNPLTGPAYLVAHGQEFPDVEFVLQGEGITLVLDGSTDIKHGITYSRFETAPDAPFTRFETTLPAGPHGILTPNVPENEDFSLCKTTLAMPTEITSQAGTTIKQTTPITLTGCGGVASFKATRAQLLAKALTACRHKHRHNKHKRATCEKQARRRYAAKTHKAGSSQRRSGHVQPGTSAG
jgi:hypothetical protein